MLNTVIESFFRIFKQPTLLIPPILVVIVQALIVMLFFSFNDTIPRFYYELFVLNIFPNVNFFESIFFVLIANVEELIFLTLAVILWFSASFWMIFSFVGIENQRKSVLESIILSIKNLGKIIGFSIFMCIILTLYLFGMLFTISIGFLGSIFTTLSILLVFVWLLIGFFLFFKLIFLPVEFFSKQEHITNSIKNIWSWSGKKFFSIIIFIIISSIVSNLILTIGISIADLFPIEDVSIFIIFLSLAISSGYFNFALVKYYFSHN